MAWGGASMFDKAVRLEAVLCLALAGCLALVYCSAARASLPDAPRFERLLANADSRNPLGTLLVMAQDDDGFMWLGSENGLARYDGHRLVIYTKDPDNPTGLPSNSVSALRFDQQGDLWLGTGAGLVVFDPKQNRFHALALADEVVASAAKTAIRALALTPSGQMLAATAAGLLVIEPNRVQGRLFKSSHIDATRAQPQLPARHPAGDAFAATEDLGIGEIVSLAAAPDGNVWLGTRDQGLALVNPQRGLILNANNQTTGFKVPKVPISHILVHSSGDVWLATLGKGVARFNPQTGQSQWYDEDRGLNAKNIWQMQEDRQGRIWMAADQAGILVYAPQTQSFRLFPHDPYDLQSPLPNGIHSVFIDRDHQLWAGSNPYGINLLPLDKSPIDSLRHRVTDPNSLSNATVLALAPSASGGLWVGTERGLNRLDPERLTSEQLIEIPLALHDTSPWANTTQPQPLGRGRLQSVLSLAEEADGDLWVGTWSDGLFFREERTGIFHAYHPDRASPHPSLHTEFNGQEPPASARKPNSAFIWALLADPDEPLVWIGTQTGGLNRLDKRTGTFTYFLPAETPGSQAISGLHVRSLLIDQAGYLWIGTLDGLDRLDRKTGIITPFSHPAGSAQGLRSREVTHLFEDRHRNLWVGTQNGGIARLNPERNEITHFTAATGLPSDSIASITEDAEGFIWATTSEGAARFIAESDRWQHYTVRNGLLSNTFNRAASLKWANYLWLGSIAGINRLDTQNLPLSQRPRIPRLTELKRFNETQIPGAPTSLLKAPLHHLRQIVIPHHQTVISLHFSALTYATSHQTRYRYRLLPRDDSWRDATLGQMANFSGLAPGNYRFQVQASDDFGQWPEDPLTATAPRMGDTQGREHTAELVIQVQPPFWLSPWAFLMYTVLLAAIVRSLWVMQRKRLEWLRDKTLNKELQSLNQLKDAFLANTSHELRTPLNGIIGLSEQLEEALEPHLNATHKMQFSMIIGSGKRLSHLINDILDMSKLGQRELHIKCEPLLLKPEVETVIALLKPLMDNKNLTLMNAIPTPGPTVLADRNRLQQILLNLINNAIKYSDQGEIRIDVALNQAAANPPIATLSTATLPISSPPISTLPIATLPMPRANTPPSTPAQGFVYIAVSDQGIGIPADQLERIFESFHQVSHNDAREYDGTGLGLSITQQLVSLHGGSIWVTSALGSGSQFSFSLPQVAPETAGTSTVQPAPKNPVINNPAINNPVTVPQARTADPGLARGALMPNPAPVARVEVAQVEIAETKVAQVEVAAVDTDMADNALPEIWNVDDNSVNRLVVTGHLKRNYRVRELDRGQAVLDLLAEGRRPDLIVMDIMMPGLSGYETCEKVRALPEGQSIPIVFLTAKTLDTEKPHALAIGANDLLSKPFKKQALIDIIQTLLAQAPR